MFNKHLLFNMHGMDIKVVETCWQNDVWQTVRVCIELQANDYIKVGRLISGCTVVTGIAEAVKSSRNKIRRITL